MLKKNVKLGIALVGMRHLNYKIYLKNNKIYPPHSPSENGCFGMYHIGQNRYHDST